jgi:hypothetical protein
MVLNGSVAFKYWLEDVLTEMVADRCSLSRKYLRLLAREMEVTHKQMKL